MDKQELKKQIVKKAEKLLTQIELAKISAQLRGKQPEYDWIDHACGLSAIERLLGKK